jgi:tRNA-dihydrouridine synthase B
LKTLYQTINIGPIALKGNLFLAPMAGYTDQAGRQVAMEHGADLTYAEMSSCEALWRTDSEKTLQIMNPYPGEEHLALQLFSGNIHAIEASMPKVLAFKPSILDLNVGCPVPKVNKSGAGSALMQHPQKLAAILRSMRASLPKTAAMTVKIRAGWNQESLNYLEIAGLALEAGADMISMHPRTRVQGYTGVANWEHLATLKRTFPQAVICASGDLNSPEAIQSMFEQTGVDAAMIARGSMGNPFIFSQTKELLTKGSYNKPSDRQKMEVAYRHFQLMLEYLGERYSTNEIKKHLAQYARGDAVLAHYRKAFVLSQSCQEMEDLFSELWTQLAS